MAATHALSLHGASTQPTCHLPPIQEAAHRSRSTHFMSARSSSHVLYSPLTALVFMVEKSMGCLMTEK